MSSTRHAEDDSTFRQERYASSPEFERGLIATGVAKRCELIDAPADRELIWFVQYLSHQDGGLAAVARDLLARYPERIGTRTMLEIGKRETVNYNADEMRLIRRELPRAESRNFPLKGETEWDFQREQWDVPAKIQGDDDQSQESAELAYYFRRASDDSDWERKQREAKEIERAENQPSSYPATKLRELCWDAAQSGLAPYKCNQKGTYRLERQLAEMCLDPEWNFAAGGPWYFSRLVETLRDYMAEFVKNKRTGAVVTMLGKKVGDELDYTRSARILTLMEGEARTGKSFSARAWCEQHPGAARFVEVPASNEDAGFFRAIARGLGLGNFLNYKAAEIRSRVESVLLTGNLLLVLDEAHRLWPRMNARYGFPKRIEWVMTMVNARVPIAMISTPQFIQTQKAVEKGGWNSAQLTGRIYNYVPLPADLSADDLRAVAKSVLPEADAVMLRAMATYARASARGLAAIDSISKRAQWIASRNNRAAATTEDVKMAMQESIVPADTKLHLALANGKKSRPLAAVTEQSIPVPPQTSNGLSIRSGTSNAAGIRGLTPDAFVGKVEN